MSKQRPLKILFCIDALVLGGTELQLIGLIDRLDRNRFSPYLLTIRPTPAELNPKDCPHLEWSIPRLVSPSGVLGVWRLARFLQRENFQVVQTFFQDSTVFAGIAAWLARVPIRLACFRDLGFWRTKGQTLMLHRVYPLMTGFLCNAEVVKRNFIENDGLRADDIRVIYNGIDVKTLTWVDHQGPTTHIGIVGNLTRRVKRTDLFIKAAGMVSRELGNRGITWHIIGDGDFRDEYEALARSEGIFDQVIFSGRISDVAGYLEKIQIGVLCSDSEGFSNALLEYMLKGSACIATDVGGNSEAVDQGRTGLLVPPDDPVALAEALKKLILDPDLRRRLAASARSEAEANFNWDVCIDQHEAIYSAE